MNILDYYKGLLVALRYQVNDDGLISTVTPTGDSRPATIDGKRLVLPTKKFMQDGFGEDFIAFHPLSESIARRGTSPVLQHMQRNAKANLAYTFHYLAEQLLVVAAEPTLHKDLPPDCADYLKKLANATEKTVDLFHQLIKAAAKKNKLMTLYLKSGGKVDGKSVNRMAVIRFPFMEALDAGDDDVLGVAIPKKHRQTLSALFRLIMPYGDSPEEYSAGSNNRTAPYLHAFLQAYHKAATQLNRIINRYAKPMELAIPVFELYSEKSLGDFSELYDQLPALAGNEGGADEHNDEAADVPDTKVKRSGATDVYQALDHQQVKHQPPQPAPTKVQVKGDEGISMAELMQRMNPVPMQQAPTTGYGVPQNYGYQPVQQQQPMYNNPLATLTNLVTGGTANQAPQVQINPYAQAVAAHHQATNPQPQYNTPYAVQQQQPMIYGQPAAGSSLL